MYFQSSLKVMLLLIITALAVVRSWYGTQLDSFTVDEPYHVVAGVSYVKTGDFRLNPEHPPLTKLWVGIFNKESFKLRDFKPLYDKFNERNYTEETMYYDNDFQQAQKLSRRAMWSFNGLLMLCLMGLVWNLIGFHAAWLIGVLMAIEPTFAAHMPVVMTDLPVAIALACCALSAWGLFRNWNLKWLLLLSLFSAAALSIKFSAITGLVALFVTLGILALWPIRNKHFKLSIIRLSKVILAGVLALVLLWSTYGFQYHAGPEGNDVFNRSLKDKISDLASPHYQNILTVIDQSHVLPRAYIWGLADTIRAGIEGRGETENFIWGTNYVGPAPWFYWPSVIVSKVPLAMQVLILLSMIVLLFALARQIKEKQFLKSGTALFTVLGVAYLLTLLSSHGTYAGIRHALPLVMVMIMYCGVVYQRYYQNKKVVSVTFILLTLTLLMTASEKRLWEYHNELVGGTENAYKYFANEGLNLGQRAGELIDYIKSNHLADEDFYIGTWLISEEMLASGIKDSNIAKDIYDENVAGIYAGYHIMNVNIFLKWEHWDPKEIDHWERVKRLGHVYLFHGSVEDPKAWVSSMANRIKEHLMENNLPDWQTIALRLEQMTAITDYKYDLYLQLGNAYIQTDQREKAINAFQKATELIDDSKLFKAKLEQQIELLQSTVPLEEVPLLRSDNVE